MELHQCFDAIDQLLLQAGVDRTRFMRISTELLGRGNIYHRASDAQAELYRDAMKILELLQAYWGLAGYTLDHDVKNGHLTMYPPGAEIPGRQQDEQYEPSGAVRRRVSADLAAFIIILRKLYEDAVTRAAVEEEGEVPVRIEDINAKMAALLKRDLPPGQVERLKLLKEARQRNFILFGEDAHIPDSSSRIAIQPTIMGILGASQCEAAIKDAEARLKGRQASATGASVPTQGEPQPATE